MNDLRYTIALDTKGKLLPELKIVKQQVEEISKSTSKLSQVASDVGTQLKKWISIDFFVFNQVFRNLSDSLSPLSAVGTGFQQGMADLQAITGIVGKDFEAVAEAARRVGKESGLGASGAVDAFTLLASQIDIDTIGLEGLMQLQKETITLAQAGGLSLSDAATAMAATINQFGLQASEANRVVNVLAAGSKMGASEVYDLAQSFRITGATAAAAGLSVEQTAAALEVLAQSNIIGSEAGTALRNVILKLQTTLGMDLSKVGLSAALDALKPKLEDVTYLSKVFGVQNIAAAQYLITNAEAVREMTAAVTGTNTAQEQAAIRTNTVAEQQKRIQATIDDLKISIFEMTGGYIGYASAVGDVAVMLSQYLPLFSLLHGWTVKIASVAGGVAVMGWVKLSSTITAAAATLKASSLTLQFYAGMLALMPGRIAAFCKALTLQKVATATVTAAQRLLNLVMTANPIGIVTAAVTALVSGLVIAYKNCDWFKKWVDSVVEGFKGMAEWVGKAWEKVKQFFGFGSEMESISTATQEATEAMQKLSDNLNGGGNFSFSFEDKNTDLSTIGGLTNKINELREAQNMASVEQAANLEKEIMLYQERLNLLKLTIAKMASGNIADSNYKDAINAPEEIPGVEAPESVAIPVTFEMSESLMKKNLQRMRQMFSDSIPEIDYLGSTMDGLRSISDIMESLSGVLNESAAAWAKWGASVLQTIAQAIPQIVSLANTQIKAAQQQTTANTSVAASGAAASVASIPIVGWVMAAAAVASVLAVLASLPKAHALAKGGIVSSPTLALVGEYSGARSNPEVIAPLDKLRSLIQPAGFGAEGLYLETKIRGKDLYVALQGVEHGKRRVR